MGRYIEFNDLVERYPTANTRGGDTTIDSGYIVPAEFEVDGWFSRHMTVPFSSNNMTVKDLAIDLTYVRLAIGKDERVDKIEKRLMDRVKRIQDGEEEMRTSDGNAVQVIGDAVFSTEEGYHTSFGPDDASMYRVDSDWMQDVEDDRG